MKGGALSIPDWYDIFERKTVPEIRAFLQEHAVDVNECNLHWGLDPTYRWSVVWCAIVEFRRDVMDLLLNEFGADLSVPCRFLSNAVVVEAEAYPIYRAFVGSSRLDALEFVLERGASPFKGCDNLPRIGKTGYKEEALGLIDAAKDRLRTAWAVAWALSQRPPQSTSVWGLCDMAQPVAQRVTGTPVREFLKEGEETQTKKRRSVE